MVGQNHSRVLLVSDQVQTQKLVAAALEPRFALIPAECCRSRADLVERLRRAPVPVVLVELGERPGEALAALDPVVAEFPDTRFVVLTDSSDEAMLFRAIEIGVRVLLKESLSTKLPALLERLMPPEALNGGKAGGSLVTVLSGGGGCGATTLAINLAYELYLQSSQPALLVDMDCAYGSVATYLGLDAPYGLADVLGHEGPIDAELVRSSASACLKGLHALVSPASCSGLAHQALGHNRQARWERLGEAIEACRQAYGHTVVDAPRVPVDLAATLARMSTRALLVLQLNVKDIRLAGSLFRSLEQRGVPSGTLIPLVSRYRSRGQMISLEEAMTSLGCTRLDRLSNDFRGAIRGLNFGQPLSRVAPRSPLRKDVRELAEKLCRGLLEPCGQKV